MFYETLAAYYDEVFPAEAGKVSFLDRHFKAVGANKILDLACGTGSYTLELARLGYEAWGTDLEPQMVEAAREKAARQQVDAHFAVGDMREADKLGQTFDGLLCIGNSLAHLQNEDDLKGALESMCRALRTGGTAVFQIVNFDRILARGETELPLIERQTLRFIRMYRPQSRERLIFDSILELKKEDGTQERMENRVELRPILKTELVEKLQDAGFSKVEIYGSFKEEPYSQDASAVVAVATK